MLRFADLTDKQKEGARRVFQRTTAGLLAAGTVVPDELAGLRARVVARKLETTVQQAIIDEQDADLIAHANAKAERAYYMEPGDAYMNMRFVNEAVRESPLA